MLGDAGAYWPLSVAAEDLRNATSSDELYEMLVSDATAHYEKREEEVTPEIMRQVERQVMLRIIDQRWREHLYAMDYLREGIHLRAMGQKDPAVEWQREGFEMFTLMMAGIDDDFVRYVMHVQVAVQQDEQPQPEQIKDVKYSAPDEPGSTGRGPPAAPRTPASSCARPSSAGS